MKVGAEPKQVAVLVGLLCVAAYFYFSGNGDTREQEQQRASSAKQKSNVVAPIAASPVEAPVNRDNTTAAQRSAKTAKVRGAIQDFKPSLKPRKEAIDPATVDPQLRTDLLAKLQLVTIQGGNRSLFDFAQAPAPKAPPPPKIIPTNGLPSGIMRAVAGAVQSGPPPAPPKPPPPAITLKFYGFVGGVKQSAKRAFFLDGDDIQVAGEGDLIKKRYKVIRIGLNSAVVEDIDHKHQQTLTLEEPQQGG